MQGCRSGAPAAINSRIAARTCNVPFGTPLLQGSFLTAVLLSCCLSAAVIAEERTAFRVCADPHSLPSSNNAQQGYENAIAKLFADALDLPLIFEWFPQRMGFIRNTLRSRSTQTGDYKCDIVMGVPDNFELAMTTRPYMRSVWAIVYVKGRGLDDVDSPVALAKLSAERKSALRLGCFDRSPTVKWLLKHGLIDAIRPYPMMTGDARAYPGQVIERDLVAGDIDAAFVWGPIAGYFTDRIVDRELALMPMASEPGMQLDYRIAMAVRFGESQWLATINELIDRHQRDIDRILRQYGVPLLPMD